MEQLDIYNGVGMVVLVGFAVVWRLLLSLPWLLYRGLLVLLLVLLVLAVLIGMTVVWVREKWEVAGVVPQNGARRGL